MVTFNVGEKDPSVDLNELFDIQPNANPADLHDFYILGLQEVAVGLKAILESEDKWIDRTKKFFDSLEYYQVKYVKLRGMVLIVYAKLEHHKIMREADIDTTVVKTGLRGTFGNKGAVVIRMVVSGTSVCIINSHFHAHEKDNDDRINDYNSVLKAVTPALMGNDYVFWMGDLNFRILHFSEKDVLDRIQEGAYKVNIYFSMLIINFDFINCSGLGAVGI